MVAPHALQQDRAARLELAGADAAEQHLFVERDDQIRFVAAVGDGPAPRRMRLPLAPATLRAGGRISAGMISTVHTPRPIRAAIAPSAWPQRCAPSPESLMISIDVLRRASRLTTIRGASVAMASRPPGDDADRVHSRTLTKFCSLESMPKSVPAPSGRAADGEPLRRECRGTLHRPRGLAASAHRLDHGRRAGDDVAAGEDARHRRREIVAGLDVAAPC